VYCSVNKRSWFSPSGLSWLSSYTVVSPANLDVADWSSWSPSLGGGFVQAECLGSAALSCSQLACGLWGQHGLEQVRRLWGWNLAEKQGAVSLQHFANPRDPDVLAHSHWNIEVCLETELLREKRAQAYSFTRKGGFISRNVTRGYFGFCSNLPVSAH